jgi:hypothetical protein
VCAGKEPITSRELDGKLYAGHEVFEWLLAVISNVMAAEVSEKKCQQQHLPQHQAAGCRFCLRPLPLPVVLCSSTRLGKCNCSCPE